VPSAVPCIAARGRDRKSSQGEKSWLLARNEDVVLNFGGKSTELWCEGGEAGFVRRMILQSAQRREQCLWFTTLVSKRGSLPAIYRALKAAQAADVRTIAMAQGQKQSRIVAWTFFTAAQRAQWRSQLVEVARLPRYVHESAYTLRGERATYSSIRKSRIE